MEKRVCYRCLIRDMVSKEKYQEKITDYISILKQEDRADEGLYEARLEACRGCDKLNDGTCAACGCYVEIRAALKSAVCPYKMWQ